MNRKEDGQALVEFALVLPLILLLVFAAVDLGQIYLASEKVQFTAQTAAEAGAAGHADAVTELVQQNLGSDAHLSAENDGQYFHANVTYDVKLISGFIFGNTCTVKGNATVFLEEK